MFWLWLGWRRLEKPPPTSLKHFLHSLWKTRKCVLTPSQKNNSLKLFMDTFHITQHHHVRCPCVHKTCRYFQPAVVLLVNDSIPTSGICNDWSAKEKSLNHQYWQLAIDDFDSIPTLAMGWSTCFLQYVWLWFLWDDQSVFRNVEVGYLTIMWLHLTIMWLYLTKIWLHLTIMWLYLTIFDWNLTIIWL